MTITEVKIRQRLENAGKLKATVSITIDEGFVVHDVKVIKAEKGLFVAFPSKKIADGEYKDVAHPINSEVREMIEKAVLEAYHKDLDDNE